MKTTLLLLTLLFSVNSLACEKIKLAHKNLVAMNFSLQKSFQLTMDGEKKIALTNIVEVENKQLRHIDERVLFQAPDFKYDEDDKEPFLLANFDCKDIKIHDDKVVINFNNDNKHYEIEYLYQAKKQLLIPVKAIISGKVSLFFATWLIKSTANYSHFISK